MLENLVLLKNGLELFGVSPATFAFFCWCSIFGVGLGGASLLFVFCCLCMFVRMNLPHPPNVVENCLII